MTNFSPNSGSEMSLKTHTPFYEFTFKWTIEQFSKLPRHWFGKSPAFSIEPESHWYVEFKNGAQYFYLFICRKQDTNFKMDYHVTISDCNSQILYSNTGNGNHPIREDAVPRIFSYMETLKKTPNDQIFITIVVRVEKNFPTTINSGNFSTRMRLGQMEKLSRDLKNILDLSLKTDLTLVVRGESVACHKAILAGRSPVFAKMFQGGLAEDDSSTVFIDDFSVSTVKALLSFMYSAEVIDYDFDTALEVYAAADKYELLDLRDMCCVVLVSKVTIETAFKVLYLADVHQDTVLKDKTLQYINIHYKPIKKEMSLKS